MEKKFCAELGSFAKSMVKEDVALSLLLVVMEKLMETEFICPCDASLFYYNTLVICSSTIIFCLIVHIKMDQYKKLTECCDCGNILRLSGVLISGVLTVFLWLFVLSYDGQYYVCKMTYWNGTWTDNPAKVPRKWCKPSANDTNFNDLQRMSSEWYFQSQVWLMHLLLYSDKKLINISLVINVHTSVDKLPVKVHSKVHKSIILQKNPFYLCLIMKMLYFCH